MLARRVLGELKKGNYINNQCASPGSSLGETRAAAAVAAAAVVSAAATGLPTEEDEEDMQGVEEEGNPPADAQNNADTTSK